jgi:hypothetical protein
LPSPVTILWMHLHYRDHPKSKKVNIYKVAEIQHPTIDYQKQKPRLQNISFFTFHHGISRPFEVIIPQNLEGFLWKFQVWKIPCSKGTCRPLGASVWFKIMPFPFAWRVPIPTWPHTPITPWSVGPFCQNLAQVHTVIKWLTFYFSTSSTSQLS